MYVFTSNTWPLNRSILCGTVLLKRSWHYAQGNRGEGCHTAENKKHNTKNNTHPVNSAWVEVSPKNRK